MKSLSACVAELTKIVDDLDAALAHAERVAKQPNAMERRGKVLATYEP